MSALIVDTSSWIEYFAGRGPIVIDEALGEGRVHLPPIVVAELLSGKLRKGQRADLEALLRTLPLCKCDVDHWIRVGALRAALIVKGFTMSTPDAHVAQCALDLGGELLTTDRVFAKVSKAAGLRLG